MSTPQFGRHLRSHWYLEDDLIYLNHGTVGATPKVVLAAQNDLVVCIERNPARFMLRELADRSGERTDTRMRIAAARVAKFVGVAANELVSVDNITTGANAVFRSFPFRSGDEILTTSLGYGGVTNAANFAARSVGATVRTVELPLPGEPSDVYTTRVVDALGPRTRMIVIDHITAQTALVLPVQEISEACHKRNIAVFVDGAHAPGNIGLDVESIGADFYAANLHKWAMFPRSSGFLWVAPQHHSTIHAAVISWGLDNGIAAEFDAPGTRDPSAFLVAPAALDFLDMLGGQAPTDVLCGVDGVMHRNHKLAYQSGERLSAAWEVPFETPESMIGSMVTVALPERLGSTDSDADRLKNALLEAERIEVPVFALNGGLYLRVSAQAYCDESDIDRLLEAVKSL
jgi:isopenicillin-N epimerase